MSPLAARLSLHSIAAAAFRLREFGIVVALVAAIVLFTAQTGRFLSTGNWRDIAINVAIVVVVAVGETMVVLTRNIDLSVGSIAGLTAFVSADTLATFDAPVAVGALVAVAVGLACGLFNGILVAVANIPAIIATLGTLFVYRGIVFELSGGQQIYPHELPAPFVAFAFRESFGIPYLALIALAVAVVGAAALRWTHWGRDFYAVGSNPEAALYAGIPVRRRVVTALAISGALAGLGGFMFAGRFATVSAVSATGLELAVISAVVIGGVNVFGGSGTVLGAVLGAVLIGVIENGFTLLRINEFWKLAFQGFAIVVAVTVDALITQRLQEALRTRRRREVLAARGGGVP